MKEKIKELVDTINIPVVATIAVTALSAYTVGYLCGIKVTTDAFIDVLEK